MIKSFFDEATGVFNIDEHIIGRESFKKILEDGKITSDEVKKQSELVIEYLKKLDNKLDDAEKAMVTDAICELLILYSLSQKNIIDEFERGF